MKDSPHKKYFKLLHELVQPLTVLIISLQYLHKEHPHLSAEESRIILERSLAACEKMYHLLKPPFKD